MLRKIIIFGVFAVASASIPMIYERNADAVHALLGVGPADDAVATATPYVAERTPPVRPAIAAPSGRSVRIQPDATGHFEGRFRLNGRDVPALIDTGATLVAINRTTARRLGINLTAADFRHEVRTANGTTPAASATIARMQIGRIDVSDVQAVVLGDDALQETLIGMSFLRALSGYAVEDGVLILRQ